MLQCEQGLLQRTAMLRVVSGRMEAAVSDKRDRKAGNLGHEEAAPTPFDALSIYEIVRIDGENELARPWISLWWSGLAAGIAVTTSVVAQGLLTMVLPDEPWRPAISSLGYSVGFLLVILGRMQLFTENTITVVLPLMADYSRHALARTARMWGIVLAANLVGVLLAACFAQFLGIAGEEELSAFRELGAHVFEKSPLELLVRAVPAGFLVAAIVWMLPNARHFEFWIIVVFTWLIAFGDMTHVVASSMEAFLLLFAGRIDPWQLFAGFFLPALVGNILGGTALFSLLAYGQVKREIEESPPD